MYTILHSPFVFGKPIFQVYSEFSTVGGALVVWSVLPFKDVSMKIPTGMSTKVRKVLTKNSEILQYNVILANLAGHSIPFNDGIYVLCKN